MLEDIFEGCSIIFQLVQQRNGPLKFKTTL